MGSFANTVFSILLGWLQGLVSMIWSALASGGDNPFLKFFENNWIRIIIVLCITGAAADFVVYLFRWKPYKVWQSFLRRIRSKSGESEEETRPEETYVSEEAESVSYSTDEPDEEDELNRWREETAEEDTAYRRPDAAPRRRRRRISNFIGDAGEDFHYYSPQPMVDRNEAYHAPVYPEKWTGGRDQES